jgi:hypothetical protein
VAATPFNLENNMCLLQCDTGYWQNYATSLVDSTDPTRDQRCSSDNCKRFDNTQSPAHCTECWNTDDMATYNIWIGRGSYTETEVTHRLLLEPFKLTSNICVLQCTAGSWSNYNKTGLISAGDPARDQRCSSDNCKTFEVTQHAKHCKTCWTQADMATFSTWIGRGSNTEAEITGRYIDVPFLLENNQCTLQCATGHWANLGTALIANTDPHLHQRCSSDNCKTFDTAISPKHCKTCWTQADMAAYSSWLGRGSYTEHEVSGRVFALPFNLENNMCALQCDAGYWANLGTTDHLISPTDAPRDQRCAFDNCKQFDNTQSPKHCTECWNTADLATYGLWLGRGSYLATEVAGRVSALPF